MNPVLQPWHLSVMFLASWINRQQQEVIEYLRTENTVLREKVGKKRILLTYDQRRRLAVKGKILGRKQLEEFGTLATTGKYLHARPNDSSGNYLPLGYEILDGHLRYQILLDMGVENVPCLIGNEREAFTGNRMVNRLSASQEMRMLRKSLEELDEKTIADALGMTSIKHRLNQSLLKKLDPAVRKAFESGQLNLQGAKELGHVKTDRQAEIISLMESCNDYSVTFARGLVLKTPAAKRVKANGKSTPWSQADKSKNDLLKKLKEAEQQQDFYSGLYRQYTTNLLKLVIYLRSLISNPTVREYLESRHPQQLSVIEQVINSTEQ